MTNKPAVVTRSIKKFFKDTFFYLIPKMRLKKTEAVILMYHSISEYTLEFSTVSPKMFSEQMYFLQKNHFPVISLSELVRRYYANEALGGSVVITFDDGYEDNYLNAYPILKKNNFPATIFVTTATIDTQDKTGRRWLTTTEIKELFESKIITIGAHTITHLKLAKTDDVTAGKEIVDSKKTLENILGQQIDLFAYPFGSFVSRTKSVVHDAGLLAAVTVREGIVNADSDIFALPRNSIDNSTTPIQFQGKLSSAITWYHRLLNHHN